MYLHTLHCHVLYIYIYIYITELSFTCTLVLHTSMCSPDVGRRRTKTLHFIIKSLELRCHAYILCLFIYIYIYI